MVYVCVFQNVFSTKNEQIDLLLYTKEMRWYHFLRLKASTRADTTKFHTRPPRLLAQRATSLFEIENRCNLGWWSQRYSMRALNEYILIAINIMSSCNHGK